MKELKFQDKEPKIIFSQAESCPDGIFSLDQWINWEWLMVILNSPQKDYLVGNKTNTDAKFLKKTSQNLIMYREEGEDSYICHN